jgi:hypothetical protein
MVHGYAELLTPREFTLTAFANDERHDELVWDQSPRGRQPSPASGSRWRE